MTDGEDGTSIPNEQYGWGKTRWMVITTIIAGNSEDGGDVKRRRPMVRIVVSVYHHGS